MTALRTAAQQALEALGLAKLNGKAGLYPAEIEEIAGAITALRAALEEPVQGCPSCEYNKQRAQLWRNEAYKLGGHPLDWEPELMVRPKPLTEEEIRDLLEAEFLGRDGKRSWDDDLQVFRLAERAHGIT